MGSQTLEILRQGIWASLTGGWFYDPHLDIFSNTFHLYVWLFLLILPFTVYLYLPPTFFIWLAYCSTIGVLFGTIKTINHALHCLFDTSECLEEPKQNSNSKKNESDKKRSSRAKRREQPQDQGDLGIELQVLNGKTDTPPVECSSRNSYNEPTAPNADADSITSDYTRDKPSSTIDLKVEIHRKNSSESSEGTHLSKPAMEKETNVDDWIEQEEHNFKKKLTTNSDNKAPRKICRHQSEMTYTKSNNLGKTGSESQIKQTSSLELEQPDDFQYWKYNQSVRRLNSNSITMEAQFVNQHPQSLEIIGYYIKTEDLDQNKIPSHPQSLEVISKMPHPPLGHPQSLETIRASNKPSSLRDENNLPLHPQSLETINSKKVLPQITLKRHQLQMLPYLSCGSEIVHPIEEQSDELILNENVAQSTKHDVAVNTVATPSTSPRENECLKSTSNCDIANNTEDNSEKYFVNFYKSMVQRVCDNDSANSRDALLEENVDKTELGNTSHSSWDLLNGQRTNEKKNDKCFQVDESANSGSVVGINWLFENGDEVEPWANKISDLPSKDIDSGSSSTTTLSIENEVKRKLLPQSEVEAIRQQQGAIPKLSRTRRTHVKNKSEPPCFTETSNRPRLKRSLATRERRERTLNDAGGVVPSCRFSQSIQGTTSNNELSTLLPSPAPPLLAPLLNNNGRPNGVIHRHHPHYLQQQQQQLQQSSNSQNELKIVAHPGNTNEIRRSRQRYRRFNRANRPRRRPRQPHQDPDFITLTRFLCHITSNNESTNDEGIKYFRDDYGRWLACPLNDKEHGSASRIDLASVSPDQNNKFISLLRQRLSPNAYGDGNWIWPEHRVLSGSSSLSLNSAGLTVIIDNPPTISNLLNDSPETINMNSSVSNATSRFVQDLGERLSVCQTLTDAERHRRLQTLLGKMESNHTEPGSQIMLPLSQEPNLLNGNISWEKFFPQFIGLDSEPTHAKAKPTKHYYKWKVGKFPHIKIRFDRLALLALLDRNLSVLETIFATLLAIVVAGLALTILHREFYRDISAFIFCFVAAGCQYSLLKSVQPDASSPTHGFNRIVVFSRPLYFILCSTLILMLDKSLKNYKSSEFRIYGFQVFDYNMILQTRNFMLCFLLSFPILFSLGLFPQFNTFIMYLCEHIDIHIFGGNATTSLVSAIYCLCRSLITVLILYGFAYGSLTEPKSSQHILFSIFAGLLVAVSYHLSRSSSDPTVIWELLKANLWPPEMYLEEKPSQVIENTGKGEGMTPSTVGSKTPKSKYSSKKKDMKISMDEQISDSELFDPLPQKLRSIVKARLKNDVIVCCVIGVLSFAIHSSSIFMALQPELNPVLWGITTCLGFLLHYIMPQLRKQLPWLCLAQPVLRSFEHLQFEVKEPVKIMWYERIYVYLCFFEKNILYPLVILGALSECSTKIVGKFGESIGALIIVVCSLKSLRSVYSDTTTRYLVLVFSVLLFRYDLKNSSINSETFLVDYFVTAIGFAKVYELLLKIRFIVTYIAPWQITWGSAFHAFAQPFSVPHSAMLFLQAIISAILSTPLNPLLGSAIFITSYVRPVKFWERDYKTRRVDHSNTRMSLHLERNLGADDNNLNSIFYEQLTRSLQHSLFGDLTLGRWGVVEQGDCFLLASDYLNCLVHIVQLGNGLVTFQLRGLEFRGTYCQQREVEAISEGIEDNDNCCCCEIGHPSHILSVNAAFSQRWLAWEVATAKYVLEGYSISDNSAVSMLQVFDFRKVLVTYYVKSIIFYAIKSPKLKQWLENQEIVDAVSLTLDKNFVDLDPVFNMNIDDDFDYRASGITRNSFCNVYLDWVQFCASKQDNNLEKSRDSCLVSICLALSLLGRRVLGAASNNTVSSVEFFLHGLHALFKGDFRITSVRDEWVLHDIDLLRNVVAKGVRMALKLHQDHFMSPETYEEPSALYEAIDNHDRNLVISHEADPLWRNAILSGAPSLLALRHVLDDGGMDEYKVIMLNKRYLSFRVIKMNRECVRGLWAGQQQELVYLRNRNPERGSIQNAKQALRNIINSSCDQPIGYPIYVSPLTTSYAETNEQLSSLIGGPLSLKAIKNNLLKLWQRLRTRCGQGCSSGGTGSNDDGGFGNDGIYSMTTYNVHTGTSMFIATGYGQSGHSTSGSQSMESSCQMGRGSLGRANTSSMSGTCRGSLPSMGKPTGSTLASLAGLLSSGEMKLDAKSETSFSVKIDKEEIVQRVRIMDPNQVYDAINLGRRIDVIWPDERMRQQGGRSAWHHWVPERGMTGTVVHRWLPNHRDPNRRSHVDKVILLVKIEDKYVPIAEQGVRDLGAEV